MSVVHRSSIQVASRSAQGVGVRALFAAVLLLYSAAISFAQSPTPGEARAEHALESAKKMGQPELYALLEPMPKGADLHMHLSGAVYAETFLAEAVKQGLCVDPAALKLTEPVANVGTPSCSTGNVPASAVLKDQHLYDQLIDSFSMRAFEPSEGFDGHDQFFSTFDRFGGLKNFAGAWLDEVATRAAAQNEQYLEIMQTPKFSHAAALGYKIGWPAGAETSISPQQLATLRDQLLADGLRAEVPVDEKEFAEAKSDRVLLEHCASQATASPACSVRIHWLYQVLRGFPPQQVFAQTLLGFEVASADPDVVGINFVMPEDGRISMQDYALQMQMLDYLHAVYPRVHITLHAGELAFGMVPPAGLRFHIRDAIDHGHAERIGHGVDVLYEDKPNALLQQMAAQHIMVEVNLTSNAVILGVAGKDHPLHAYMAAHVPWALSTDDEGVSRIDLTHEYVRGVTDQDLSYRDLKRSARTSLEHAFLHGESLWAKPDDFTARKAACATPITERSTPAPACQSLLNGNEKAAEEWELERRLAAFEATMHQPDIE
jgi:adenosine deaminase